MKLSDIPAKFNIPFASSAGAGFIRSIPQTPTGTDGQASLQEGFPPANFNPVSAGGVPPFGQDFNGLHYQETAWNRWQAAGGAFPPYDSTFQTAIGGYPQFACVSSLVEVGLVWMSIVDDNVTNPDTGGAGWWTFIRIVTANKDLYVNGSTGNDSNNGLSPATALATIQAAMTKLLSYPPNPFTMTVHVADGTYTGQVNCPAEYFAGGVDIVGNVTTPANCFLNVSSGDGFFISGSYKIRGFKVAVASAGSGGGLGSGVRVNGGSASIGPIEFGACAGPQILSDAASLLTFQPGTVTKITGGGTAHMQTNAAGVIDLTACVLQQSGTTAFSSAFALSQKSGTIQGVYTSQTISGTVTGPRYYASLNGVIQSNGSSTYFPGSVAGSTATGGQYA